MVSIIIILLLLTGLSVTLFALGVIKQNRLPRTTHSIDHMLFNIRFCQNTVHALYLDLLRLISRKAWLTMLVVKINKEHEDCLLSLCLASSCSPVLKIVKFQLFS